MGLVGLRATALDGEGTRALLARLDMIGESDSLPAPRLDAMGTQLAAAGAKRLAEQHEVAADIPSA
jgi:hypothetical protein